MTEPGKIIGRLLPYERSKPDHDSDKVCQKTDKPKHDHVGCSKFRTNHNHNQHSQSCDTETGGDAKGVLLGILLEVNSQEKDHDKEADLEQTYCDFEPEDYCEEWLIMDGLAVNENP